MLLFIDTETTGLIDFALPLLHPSQPRLVELAAYLTDNAEQHVASVNAVIKPDGWHISDGAAAVHGITVEYARSFGEPLLDVLNRFDRLLTQAIDSDIPDETRIVAHNMSFDHRVLLSEFARCNLNPRDLNTALPFCTMRALTARMKLPRRNSRHHYKWPTLDEAYRYCFNVAVPVGTDAADGRHRAMTDLLACRDIFFHGRKEGWWR